MQVSDKLRVLCNCLFIYFFKLCKIHIMGVWDQFVFYNHFFIIYYSNDKLIRYFTKYHNIIMFNNTANYLFIFNYVLQVSTIDDVLNKYCEHRNNYLYVIKNIYFTTLIKIIDIAQFLICSELQMIIFDL